MNMQVGMRRDSELLDYTVIDRDRLLGFVAMQIDSIELLHSTRVAIDGIDVTGKRIKKRSYFGDK